jgi:hypothetical protein
MDNFLASISLLKTYIKNLDKIVERLKTLKQANESAMGAEEASNSQRIENDISAGMELQNKANDLMKTITELLKTLKEDVIYTYLKIKKIKTRLSFFPFINPLFTFAINLSAATRFIRPSKLFKNNKAKPNLK